MASPGYNSRPARKFSGRRSCLVTLLALILVITVATAVLTFVAGRMDGPVSVSSKQAIGIVEVKGIIISGDAVLKALDKFRRDDSIKAVLIRIDSPGGGVAATQEIYAEVMRTRKKKIVVASLGSLAASGGLYVASSANKVMANPGTLTGSLGVIMQFANYEDLFKKIGLKSITIKSGEFKDIGSPSRPMTRKERQYLETLVNKIHKQFVNDVARGRGLPVEEVAAFADGRVFTGEDAVALGLVDRLGNFRDAINWTKKLAGIKGDVKLVYPAKKFQVLDFLTTKWINGLLPNNMQNPINLQFLWIPEL